MAYKHIHIPTTGEKISIKEGKLNVPDQPIVGYVEGDGIGPDITNASLRVWDCLLYTSYVFCWGLVTHLTHANTAYSLSLIHIFAVYKQII